MSSSSEVGVHVTDGPIEGHRRLRLKLFDGHALKACSWMNVLLRTWFRPHNLNHGSLSLRLRAKTRALFSITYDYLWWLWIISALIKWLQNCCGFYQTADSQQLSYSNIGDGKHASPTPFNRMYEVTRISFDNSICKLFALFLPVEYRRSDWMWNKTLYTVSLSLCRPVPFCRCCDLFYIHVVRAHLWFL